MTEVFERVDAFLLGRRTDAGVATGLRLADSRTTGSGVAIHVYQPVGRPEFGEVVLG
jgi:hypothetical protein